MFSRSVTSCTREAKPTIRPPGSTSGVLYHSHWMVCPLRVTFSRLTLVPSRDSTSSAHIASTAAALDGGTTNSVARRPIASPPGKPKMASAAGFHAVTRCVAVPLDDRERRALDVHAQLLRRDEFRLLRPQALQHLVGQRVVGLLQLDALLLELVREHRLVLAHREGIDQRPVELLVHVRQDAGEQEDRPGEEPLDAVAGEAQRQREGHEPDEGRDLEGVRVRRVVADGAGDEEGDQHHHRQALREVRRIGQEEGRRSRPSRAR